MKKTGASIKCPKCPDSSLQPKSNTLISPKTSFLPLTSFRATPPAPRTPPPSRPTAFPSLSPTKRQTSTACFPRTSAIQVNSFLISLTNLQTPENRPRKCECREGMPKIWCRVSARNSVSSNSRSRSSKTTYPRKSRLLLVSSVQPRLRLRS